MSTKPPILGYARIGDNQAGNGPGQTDPPILTVARANRLPAMAGVAQTTAWATA